MTKKGKKPEPSKDGQERPTLTADELQEEFERSIRNGTFPAHYFPEWAARFRVRIGTLVRERSRPRPAQRQPADRQQVNKTQTKLERKGPAWRNPAIWTGLQKYLAEVPNGQGKEILTKREFDQLSGTGELRKLLKERLEKFKPVQGFWNWLLGLFGIETQQDENSLGFNNWQKFRAKLQLTEDEDKQGRNTWMESVAPRTRSDPTSAGEASLKQGASADAPQTGIGQAPNPGDSTEEQVLQEESSGGTGINKVAGNRSRKTESAVKTETRRKQVPSKGGSVLSTPPTPLPVEEARKGEGVEKNAITLQSRPGESNSKGTIALDELSNTETTISSESLLSTTDGYTSSSSDPNGYTLQEFLEAEPELAELASAVKRLTAQPGPGRGWSQITPETGLKQLLEAFESHLSRSSENRPFSAEVKSIDDLEKIFLRLEESLKDPSNKGNYNQLVAALVLGFYIHSRSVIMKAEPKERKSLITKLTKILKAMPKSIVPRVLVRALEESLDSWKIS